MRGRGSQCGLPADRASYRQARGTQLPTAKANPVEGPGLGRVVVAAPESTQEAWAGDRYRNSTGGHVCSDVSLKIMKHFLSLPSVQS